MKTKMTLLLALLIGSSAAFANNNEGTKNEEKIKKATQIALINDGSQQFRLIYPYKDAGKVTIAVVNENGHTIEKDKVYNKNGFLRRYDMTSLEEGNYTMVLTSGNSSLEKPFMISKVKKMAANHLGAKRVKLIVSDEITKGQIKIYNKNFEVIHEEKYSDKNGMSRVFDLSAYDCDEFTFELDGQYSVAVNTK